MAGCQSTQPGRLEAGNSSFDRNAVSAYPWGAHYVPLVRQDCQPVLELFQDLKIIVDEDARGRPIYDELHLSSDPQERLWMFGRWQDGLIPQLGSTARDRAEFTAFFAATEQLTLFPLLYWHTHLPRPFVWFLDGDFVAPPSGLWACASQVSEGCRICKVLPPSAW